MSSIAIIGHDLDIDHLLSVTRLRGFSKAYKGSKKTPNSKRELPYSFLVKEIAQHNDDLSVEIKKTLEYLKRHKYQFLLIKEIKEVEYITLDFHRNSFLESKLYFNYTFYFPADFIQLCGELGISIEYSHHVSGEEN